MGRLRLSRFDTEVGGGFLLGATFMLILMTFASCATTGGSFCDIARPIRLSPATVDAMTDAEVEAALSLNLKGEKLCGWKQ